MNPLCVQKFEGVSVELVAAEVAKRDSAVEWADMIEVVENTTQQEAAVTAQRELAIIESEVEKARVSVKGPVIALGKLIDRKAEEFLSPVTAGRVRLGKLVSGFVARQMRDAEEAARVAARLRREQEEAAAKLAQDQSEAYRIGNAEEPPTVVAPPPIRHLPAPLPVTPPPVRVTGQVIRREWVFDVVDVNALHAARPDLTIVEPARAKIHAAIKAGAREIPGLVIREQITSGVRV